MNRNRPVPCPETGETCTNPDCSVSYCVGQAKLDPLRELARAEHRDKVIRGMDPRDISLDDL